MPIILLQILKSKWFLYGAAVLVLLVSCTFWYQAQKSKWKDQGKEEVRQEWKQANEDATEVQRLKNLAATEQYVKDSETNKQDYKQKVQKILIYAKQNKTGCIADAEFISLYNELPTR